MKKINYTFDQLFEAYKGASFTEVIKGTAVELTVTSKTYAGCFSCSDAHGNSYVRSAEYVHRFLQILPLSKH